MYSTDRKDISYYLKCFFGGALSCGSSQALLTPVDLVKCRIQMAKNIYPSLFGGMRIVRIEEGFRGLYLGWLPTMLGYSLQGMGKFGFYEVFKDVYAEIIGKEKSEKYKKWVWAGSAMTAELIADVFLCPFESVKVRMQVSLPPGSFTSKFSEAWSIMAKEQGNPFFKALGPLWARQLPKTIVKFVAFEYFVEKIYQHILTEGKDEYSKATQLVVSFLAGYSAGIFCAIASNPADTMVQRLNSKDHGRKSSESLPAALSRIYTKFGFRGLWFGVEARIFMIGTLTALQWWSYDTFKTVVGLHTTGAEKFEKKVIKH